MESLVFKGGLPYAPDVERLKEAFPVAQLVESSIIPHEKFETVLGLTKKDARYYGVINAWVSQERNDNAIFMAWEPKLGVKILAPAEILHCAETRTRQKIRQTGKAIKTFTWVDRSRLDDIGRKRLDHDLRIANAVKESIESARKQLSVELSPVKSLPKPKP